MQPENFKANLLKTKIATSGPTTMNRLYDFTVNLNPIKQASGVAIDQTSTMSAKLRFSLN